MPVIEHQDDIEASPEAVFALVGRVEQFAHYSDAIDSIVRLGDNRYEWLVRVAGLPLRFDVEITEFSPPERFAWRSVTGVPTRGCYRLIPIEGGTRIHLTLEYRLYSRKIERAVNVAAKPLLRMLSRDIIGNVERELKAQQRGRG
ncbi:SRPBCC family protein [Aquisalimonas sp.]|uniref:SRPBCC family protein n=1 Tax=Aquisalimonas sp. TaxID=1872621 RepID=UPI0025B8083E|nr:SRPBCC family protein [Aquisalimonas sp.]